MLSEKLKENTKTEHQELEKLLVQKIKSIRTTEDYLAILGHFYRFFAPLEKEIIDQLSNSLSDIENRRKTAWILEDLEYFQGSFPPMAAQCPRPTIENNFQAVGALYVLEGSTLGGKIICKMIAIKLEIPMQGGFRFFSGYGDNTNEMWEDFKTFMDSRSWVPEEEDAVIVTANQTFNLFKQSMF